MKIMIDEPFAPVMPVLDFSRLDEVIAAANATPYGLAAYVFTNDLTIATRMAEGLEAGIIGVNDPVPATPQCPFGGMKESGHGPRTRHGRPRRLLRDQVRLGRAATRLIGFPGGALPWAKSSIGPAESLAHSVQNWQGELLLLLLLFLNVRVERLCVFVKAFDFLKQGLDHVDFLDMADRHAPLEDDPLAGTGGDA